MPFDNTNYEPEPSLEGLIEWLEGQQPETEYDFVRSGQCLLTRFFGHKPEQVGINACGYRDSRGQLVTESYEHPFFVVARDGEWTYGAALQRARALLRETAAVG